MLNCRPLDLGSNTLSTQPHAPVILYQKPLSLLSPDMYSVVEARDMTEATYYYRAFWCMSL